MMKKQTPRITEAKILELRNCDDPLTAIEEHLKLQPHESVRVTGANIDIKTSSMLKQVSEIKDTEIGKIGMVFYLHVTDSKNMSIEKLWVWIRDDSKAHIIEHLKLNNTKGKQ